MRVPGTGVAAGFSPGLVPDGPGQAKEPGEDAFAVVRYAVMVEVR